MGAGKRYSTLNCWFFLFLLLFLLLPLSMVFCLHVKHHAYLIGLNCWAINIWKWNAQIIEFTLPNYKCSVLFCSQIGVQVSLLKPVRPRRHRVESSIKPIEPFSLKYVPINKWNAPCCSIKERGDRFACDESCGKVAIARTDLAIHFINTN